MIDELKAFLADHHDLVIWIVVGLVVVSVGGILLTPWLVGLIPADYFVGDEARPLPWAQHHPLIRGFLWLFKNLLGLFLILLGIVLSLPGVPGPGFITIIIGLILVDLPGRRRLEQGFIRRPFVFRSVNKLRAMRGKGPLEMPAAPCEP